MVEYSHAPRVRTPFLAPGTFAIICARCIISGATTSSKQNPSLNPSLDFTYRTPTAQEYEKYGHGKPPSATKAKKKHMPNLVIYSDISGDGDVSNHRPLRAIKFTII